MYDGFILSGNPRRRIEQAREQLLAMRAQSAAAANATAAGGATSAPSPAASG